MGFRSTFTTTDLPIHWPRWFREKYQTSIFVPEVGALHSRREYKVYGPSWENLVEDVQRAIPWKEWIAKGNHLTFVLVFLHECGGITKVHIHPDRITWLEPDEWHQQPDEIGHGYHCRDTCNRGPEVNERP